MDEQTRASRGRFLGTVGAASVAGAAIAGGAWRTSKAGAAAAPVAGRSYSAGHFALELDGVKEVAFLASAEGGHAVGEVVHEFGSASYYQKKHIGNVKYENITVELGLSSSKGIYDWISATLSGSRDHERKSGAIVSADFNYDVKSKREFNDALLTEIEFPAMDAAAKDVAFISVQISPDSTASVAGSGKLTPEPKKQKLWSPANFRFEMKGLPTARVSKIDAFTIKQTVVTGEIGEQREPQREPGKLEFPNIVLTLSELDAKPWYDLFEDFVLEGNSSDADEQTAQLTYFAPGLTEQLGRLDFFNVGIFKVSPEKTETNSASGRRIKVELYCERIEFTHLAGNA